MNVGATRKRAMGKVRCPKGWIATLAALTAVAAVACSGSEDRGEESGALRVVTTVSPITSLVENIGGTRRASSCSRVASSSMITPTASPAATCIKKKDIVPTRRTMGTVARNRLMRYFCTLQHPPSVRRRGAPSHASPSSKHLVPVPLEHDGQIVMRAIPSPLTGESLPRT